MLIKENPKKENVIKLSIDNITRQCFGDNIKDIDIKWMMNSDFKNYTGIFAFVFVDEEDISEEDFMYLDNLGLHHNLKAEQELTKNNEIVFELDSDLLEHTGDFFDIILSRIYKRYNNLIK